MAVLIPGVGLVDTTNSVLLPGGVWQATAAGGGATPTLSSPTVTSIGQTTATPQVTVTFA